MRTASLAFLTAAELSALIRRREVSPVDVVREVLDRIERLEPRLLSHITVLPERALDDARAAEAEIVAGRWRGPLHGVPLGLKDLIDTRGIRTTAGSRILADNVPERDACVTERLIAAGAILIGKHNLHEFAFGTTSANAHHGVCVNPWSPQHSPGGSSGGTGAALAAGFCAIAIGTDTGGSIRIPASVCGVVGLKPTLGRVSRRGVFPLSWSLDHAGPMTRSVEDAALVLQAVAGEDAGDSWSAPRPSEDFSRDLEKGVAGLRIGVPRPLFPKDLPADVARAVDEALGTLEALGARRVELDVPELVSAYTAFHGILVTEAATIHERWMRERPEDYGDAVREAIEPGYVVSAVEYVNARRVQARVRDALSRALGDVDVLATPTLPRTALRLGEAPSREPDLAWGRLLIPFNLSGHPAISIPCGLDAAGLPIGLQIAGRHFEESTVLRAARAYERETRWQRQRPPGLD